MWANTEPPSTAHLFPNEQQLDSQTGGQNCNIKSKAIEAYFFPTRALSLALLLLLGLNTAHLILFNSFSGLKIKLPTSIVL